MIVIKNILLFIFMLTLIVSLHELGHLIAAKIFGVYCKEYSIGMGPKIYSHKGKETEFCIRAFPIGGFVAMAGDDENSLETKVDTTDIPVERTLNGIARWKRVIIMLAGIFMNMVLALVIYSLIILYNGSYTVGSKPQISSIMEDYPAEKAGLKTGDIITKIGFNDMSISPEDYFEIIDFTSAYNGEGSWTVEVEREGEKLTFELIPEYLEDEQRYVIGIGFDNIATEVKSVNILNCWYYGFKYLVFIIKFTFTQFVSIFRTMNISSFSGPVGIYTTVSEVSAMGLYYYAQLIALISVNVGILNALPLPIFDGGRVLILLIEMLIGHELPRKTQEIIMTASVALLLMLLIFVTYNDISRLIGG